MSLSVKSGRALLPLSILMLIAVLTRFSHLTFQSLWLDEIYTMTTAAPWYGWKEIFEELKSDFHPPLHYLLCNAIFKITTYNDLTGRIISAMAGIAGVYAIYHLGKNVLNHKSGLYLAFLTVFSYYHLYHSQEVRMYIFLFLFAVLATHAFIRFQKSSGIGSIILLVILNTLLLYTHYFGFFIVGAQAMVMIHLKITDKGENHNFIWFFTGGIITAILYLPWLPYVMKSGGEDHWMSLPHPGFFFNYIYGFTGKDPLAAIIILTGLILFIAKAIKGRFEPRERILSLVAGYGLISVFLLAYIVSIFKPVLQLRCAIAALPFLFIIVVVGFSNLKLKVLYTIGIAYGLSFTINILFLTNYYTKLTKENYRDISSQVIKVKPNAFYISHYHRYYNYYFKQFNAPVMVSDVSETIAEDVLKNKKEVIVLNAHQNTSFTGMQIYSDWARELNNFTKIREFRIKGNDTEYGELFVSNH